MMNNSRRDAENAEKDTGEPLVPTRFRGEIVQSHRLHGEEQ